MTENGTLQRAWDDRSAVDMLFNKEDIPEELGTETNKDQLAALLMCWAIFVERNSGRYHDLWLLAGTRGNLSQARHKLMRVERMLEGWEEGARVSPDEMDDVFDLVNYALFAFRCALTGNLEGK